MSEALGTIETIGYVTAVVAADAAAKAANVRVLGAENAKGGGRVAVKMIGDVGAVKAAMSAAIAAAERIGRVAGWQVIPRPHTEIVQRSRLVDLGSAKGGSTAPRPAPVETASASSDDPQPPSEPEPAAAPQEASAAPTEVIVEAPAEAVAPVVPAVETTVEAGGEEAPAAASVTEAAETPVEPGDDAEPGPAPAFEPNPPRPPQGSSGLHDRGPGGRGKPRR